MTSTFIEFDVASATTDAAINSLIGDIGGQGNEFTIAGYLIRMNGLETRTDGLTVDNIKVTALRYLADDLYDFNDVEFPSKYFGSFDTSVPAFGTDADGNEFVTRNIVRCLCSFGYNIDLGDGIIRKTGGICNAIWDNVLKKWALIGPSSNTDSFDSNPSFGYPMLALEATFPTSMSKIFTKFYPTTGIAGPVGINYSTFVQSIKFKDFLPFTIQSVNYRYNFGYRPVYRYYDPADDSGENILIHRSINRTGEVINLNVNSSNPDYKIAKALQSNTVNFSQVDFTKNAFVQNVWLYTSDYDQTKLTENNINNGRGGSIVKSSTNMTNSIFGAIHITGLYNENPDTDIGQDLVNINDGVYFFNFTAGNDGTYAINILTSSCGNGYSTYNNRNNDNNPSDPSVTLSQFQSDRTYSKFTQIYSSMKFTDFPNLSTAINTENINFLVDAFVSRNTTSLSTCTAKGLWYFTDDMYETPNNIRCLFWINYRDTSKSINTSALKRVLWDGTKWTYTNYDAYDPFSYLNEPDNPTKCIVTTTSSGITYDMARIFTQIYGDVTNVPLDYVQVLKSIKTDFFASSFAYNYQGYYDSNGNYFETRDTTKSQVYAHRIANPIQLRLYGAWIKADDGASGDNYNKYRGVAYLNDANNVMKRYIWEYTSINPSTLYVTVELGETLHTSTATLITSPTIPITIEAGLVKLFPAIQYSTPAIDPLYSVIRQPTSNYDNNSLAKIGNAVPVGTITTFMGIPGINNSIADPEGWIICNGYSRFSSDNRYGDINTLFGFANYPSNFTVAPYFASPEAFLGLNVVYIIKY